VRLEPRLAAGESGVRPCPESRGELYVLDTARRSGFGSVSARFRPLALPVSLLGGDGELNAPVLRPAIGCLIGRNGLRLPVAALANKRRGGHS
jgi:hypothetical protein